MGLDMYLYGYPRNFPTAQLDAAHTYERYCAYMRKNPNEKITFAEWGGANTKKPPAEVLQFYFEHRDKIREELAYWRKANEIHKWFEEHVANNNLENCELYPVEKTQLIELKELCERTLNALIVKDGEVVDGEKDAEKLLPTERGCFFGPTDYGQYYIEDLEDTIKQLDHILKTVNFDTTVVCYWAWW